MFLYGEKDGYIRLAPVIHQTMVDPVILQQIRVKNIKKTLKVLFGLVRHDQI